MASRVLYLVGTDHSVQHNGRTAYEGQEFHRIHGDFEKLLTRKAQDLHVRAIAEELNNDVLTKFSATKSVAHEVASRLRLTHLFCEPSLNERAQLGIKVNCSAASDLREIFWLERLESIKESPILFIVGADHVRSFSERAKSSGFTVAVVEEYFAKEFFHKKRVPFATI